MVKILIADDHKMFVDGIASILKEEADLQIVGQTQTGKGIFQLLKKTTVDLILLDMNLLDTTGIEVSKQLQAQYPDIQILVISMINQESYITEVLKYGVSGYILKDTDKDELLKAIRTVAQGRSFFSQEVQAVIMQSLVSNKKKQKNRNRIPKMTRREKEVLHLIAQEYTTQEIAKELSITVKTVESHRRSLLAKFEVRNAVGLIREAMAKKIINITEKPNTNV